MKVLLCAGFGPANFKRLDDTIKTLENLKFEVVVVLAGNSAEDLLRGSKNLERCEMVFDTHGEQATLMTNIYAGLHSTLEAIFALPLTIDVPSETVWYDLIKAYYQAGLRTPSHGFWASDYPLLITRAGGELFRKAADLENLNDGRLILEVVDQGKLASGANAL